eukprot:COSAG01_NODE_3717_length_5767_cov_157.763585_1_plen_54_part_00
MKAVADPCAALEASVSLDTMFDDMQADADAGALGGGLGNLLPLDSWSGVRGSV